MKKILFLTSCMPYPVKNGRHKTLMQYLEFLSLRQDIEIYLYCFEKDPSKFEQQIEYMLNRYSKIKEIKIIALPNIINSATNIIKYTLIKKKSIQECFYFNISIKNKLWQDVSNIRPNIIFCDMLRTAQYFEDASNKLEQLIILDMDDLLSLRYRHLLEHNEVNVLGEFSNKIPRIIDVIANKLIRNIILKYESALLKHREKTSVKNFEKVLLVSPFEREKLKQVSKNQTYIVYIQP
ncbi:hypothetical protein N752_07275 [Desulforamulus aquiferis]|nr:hypothetical protein [Desulforamulus aquiferis]RYD05690.1 hypothetical protein N752_07275 [Desulforamulus aquiferis]